MQVAFDTLRRLSDGKFHSGTVLAQCLNVSRSSIWQGISYLRKLKLNIHAVPGRGYRWYSPLELLNKNIIYSALDTATQALLPRIDLVNIIKSTNDYLILRIPHGILSGTVCIAEGQTGGKGRLGKKWSSPFGGNIYLSLYWRFSNKLYDLSGLSLVIGLAVLEALKEMSPCLPEGIGIKWPNDIWHNNAKLCGILIETLGNNVSNSDVVIGIGLNLKMPAQENIATDWTDLFAVLGFVPSRNILIAKILNILIPMLEKFQQHGFSEFIELWTQYDLLAGKRIYLSNGQNLHLKSDFGVAQGVNNRGELCVKIGNTLKAIRYGEISVRPNVSEKNQA